MGRFFQNVPLTSISPVSGRCIAASLRRAAAFLSAFARLAFAFALRFEAELFELLDFACLLDRVFEVELLLSFASRANVLVAATQIIADTASANLMIFILSKNRLSIATRLPGNGEN